MAQGMIIHRDMKPLNDPQPLPKLAPDCCAIGCSAPATKVTYGPGLYLDTYTYGCDAHIEGLTNDGGTVEPIAAAL